MPSLLEQVSASATASGGWGGVVASLGQQAVGSVTFRTQVSPDVVVDPFAPAPPSTGPNPLMMLLRPEVEVRDRQGGVLFSLAPYGRPTSNYLPWLVAAAAVFSIGLVVVIGAVARRIGK